MDEDVNIEYETYMELALEQAKIAYSNGEFPVGCVIVQDGQVIASGARRGTTRENLVCSEIDHAEIRAIKALEKKQIVIDPDRTLLLSTMEPCLMCYGAIILAGIKRIVYSFEDPMGGGTGVDLTMMTPLYKKCGIEVVPGVLREKSLDLFYDFFNKETNQYWKDSFLEAYTISQKQEKQEK
jgi:tRNA(adenine34) deaminase